MFVITSSRKYHSVLKSDVKYLICDKIITKKNINIDVF